MITQNSLRDLEHARYPDTRSCPLQVGQSLASAQRHRGAILQRRQQQRVICTAQAVASLAHLFVQSVELQKIRAGPHQRIVLSGKPPIQLCTTV